MSQRYRKRNREKKIIYERQKGDKNSERRREEDRE